MKVIATMKANVTTRDVPKAAAVKARKKHSATTMSVMARSTFFRGRRAAIGVPNRAVIRAADWRMVTSRPAITTGTSSEIAR